MTMPREIHAGSLTKTKHAYWEPIPCAGTTPYILKSEYDKQAEANRVMGEAYDSTIKEFERLKEEVMKRDDLPFSAKLKDAVYLDAVLAVITTEFETALKAADEILGER